MLNIIKLGLAAALVFLPGAPLTAQTPLTEHTISLDEGTERASASLDDLRWMTGRWLGEGLGATAEVTWLPPADGAMSGVFRLVRDGVVQFYEFVTVVEENGSLTKRLKHFDPGLVGWEAKDESVSFLLVDRDGDTFWFDGLTLRRVNDDLLRIWVALQSREGDVSEGFFEYRRVPPGG